MLSNPWMKRDGDFIVVDGERFTITLVSADVDEVNAHCAEHQDRSVICEDEDGNAIVVLDKPT